MSASDALAAIQTIYTVVSKVKDNQDELKRLSKRIQFVVEALEDSWKRDIIRDTEYNDNLTTIFELIARIERLTKRMLKRSLGDRTWNAGEITNELRMLNDDVQTFLTVHSIKTLDLVHTTQTQHQQYLTSTVEEIVAKISELDLATKQHGQPPKPSPSTGNRGLALSQHQIPPRTLFAHTQTPNPGFPKASGSEQASLSLANSGHAEDIDIDRVKSPKSYPLKISGLHRASDTVSYSPGNETATFTLNSNARLRDVFRAIEEAGYQPPQSLIEDNILRIAGTKGHSVYDATSSGGLQISSQEPLIWWKDKYDEFHGLSTSSLLPMKTDIIWQKNELQVDGLTVRCHRTLRVPDRDRTSNLPPNMGAFPLFPVSHLGSRAPPEMRSRGGFIMPMFRREALWISFKSDENPGPAVKVSVGGINAVSGVSTSDPSPLKSTVSQDYIVAGKQPWLDGIVVGPGIVRQFVVTELGQGYTVEEQVTGEAKVGGLQFDVYPRRKLPSGNFHAINDGPLDPSFYKRYLGTELKVTSTPDELQCQNIGYVRWSNAEDPAYASQDSWLLSHYARRVSAAPQLTADYLPYAIANDVFELQANIYGVATNSIKRGGRAAPTGLGIAAGGKIEQKIYRDTDSVRMYNEQLGRRFHIHIVTPEYWEDLTGVLPPITPITHDLYMRHGIPWFKLFDDYLEGIVESSEDLANVVSLSQLDKEKLEASHPGADRVVDPDAPPPCFRHPHSRASCVFRPCGHTVCPACLGTALLGGSRCTCGAAISKFIGMKEPLPQVSVAPEEGTTDDGDHWNVLKVEELALNAVTAGEVTFIHLREDAVAPLQQSHKAKRTKRRTSSLQRDGCQNLVKRP